MVNVEMSAMDFERNPENVGGVAGYRWGGRVLMEGGLGGVDQRLYR